MIVDHNEPNKNVHYDINKEKDISQKSSKRSDDKVNKNAFTDTNKTDLKLITAGTLMVPQISTKVEQMTSEEKR